jgi:hypothetical protein
MSKFQLIVRGGASFLFYLTDKKNQEEGNMGLEHEFYLITNTTDVKDFWMFRENNNNGTE